MVFAAFSYSAVVILAVVWMKENKNEIIYLLS
jgi:hypothetical protein